MAGASGTGHMTLPNSKGYRSWAYFYTHNAAPIPHETVPEKARLYMTIGIYWDSTQEAYAAALAPGIPLIVHIVASAPPRQSPGSVEAAWSACRSAAHSPSSHGSTNRSARRSPVFRFGEGRGDFIGPQLEAEQRLNSRADFIQNLGRNFTQGACYVPRLSRPNPCGANDAGER